MNASPGSQMRAELTQILLKGIIVPGCGGGPMMDTSLCVVKEPVQELPRQALSECCISMLLHGSDHTDELDWLVLWGTASILYRYELADCDAILSLRSRVVETYGQVERLRAIDFLIAALARRAGAKPPPGIDEVDEQMIFCAFAA